MTIVRYCYLNSFWNDASFRKKKIVQQGFYSYKEYWLCSIQELIAKIIQADYYKLHYHNCLFGPLFRAAMLRVTNSRATSAFR